MFAKIQTLIGKTKFISKNNLLHKHHKRQAPFLMPAAPNYNLKINYLFTNHNRHRGHRSHLNL